MVGCYNHLSRQACGYNYPVFFLDLGPVGAGGNAASCLTSTGEDDTIMHFYIKASTTVPWVTLCLFMYWLGTCVALGFP